LAAQDRQRARSEAQDLAYVKALRRASSVISRAKAETWQATYNDLSPNSNPHAVFHLRSTVAGKKGSSATQNFLTPNPPKTLPKSALPTFTHTSLNKLPVSLVVPSIAT